MATPISNSKVAIWNRALSRIQQTKLIESEDERTTAAEQCRLHYGDCLGQVLERARWPFATKQSSLAQPAGVARVGWEYVYTLPDDFKTFVAFVSTSGARYENAPYDIQASDDGAAKVMVTDLPPASFDVLEYVGIPGAVNDQGEILEQPAVYDREFVSAVVWLLAAELACALPKAAALHDWAMAHYEAAVERAIAQMRNNLVDLPEPETPSIAVRSGVE